MKETKDKKKKIQENDNKSTKEYDFPYISKLEIEEDFQAFDIAEEAYQAY